ncbi:uncharacterized protein KD926_000288 [Aspergillus affinis]|uniref:uncharacterized protein n=1 Tax=Aspergillus affinis TaxID=1070780 RepID=UPI0022FEC5D6|nr:uncharacterized protein KD926_000288 [Aspergillus affinis]KAI9037493.1 hypothetical protein KD926_000288 [Aspergillus affinis]
MTSSFDSENATKVKVILKSRDDWRTWIRNIKEYAERLDVWDHFDPERADGTHPPTPVKPERPQNLTDNAYRGFQLDLQEYKDSRNNIAKVEDAIRSSIAVHVQPLIEEKRRFEILKVLKMQYEPSKVEMQQKALKQYQEVIRRSPRKGKINAWIEEFDHAYLAIKRLELPHSGDLYVQQEFLTAIEKVDQQYSNMHYSSIGKTTYSVLLSDFRAHLANSRRDDASVVSHAYATLNGQTDTPIDQQEPQGETKGRTEWPPCACGGQHRFRDCNYLYPETRPKGWKPDERVIKEIKKIASGPTSRAKRIRDMIRKNWKEADESPQDYHVMALSCNASLDIPLTNCFIIDTGSSTHVCNEISRFEELDQTKGGQLHAGDSTVKIQGFGKVRIRPNCGGEKGDKEIVLTNVAFVPGLHTNILSAQKIKRAGYDFSMTRNTISRNGKVVFNVEEHSSGLWIIEKKGSTHYGLAMIRNDQDSRRSARPHILKGNTDLWHRRMAHLHWDALRHLPEAAQGVKIDDFRAKQHDDPKCEVCRHSEAPRQTSRRSMMTAQAPLQRVHFDLIQMKPALNGDQWISHFYDENTRFHNVFSHRLKNGCVGAFNTYILQMQNIAKTKIRFFKSDREQTLGNAVKEEEALKGIIHEYSVVDTPDQNGAAERAGAILILKARKMMIEAKLPRDLWPWVIGGAANIANRSPTAALGWKTPYEKLSGKKPDLSAFRTIGCVAYTRQEQQKSDKMAPRAYKGILLGYVASNIWHIWNPRKQRVEEARDVLFDETRMYDPTQPFLEDLISETSPEPPTEVLDLPRGEGIFLEEEPNRMETGEVPRIEGNAYGSNDASNNEIMQKLSDRKVAEGQGVATVDHPDHPAQPSTLPTPESTPEPHVEPNNQEDRGRTEAIPGGFPEDPLLEEPDAIPHDEAASRMLEDSLQNSILEEEEIRISSAPPTAQHHDSALQEDHDSTPSSRSGGGRGGRRSRGRGRGPTDDGAREENILQGRRVRQPRKDMKEYQSYAMFEPYIEDPYIVENVFSMALDLAAKEKKRWHRNELPPLPKSYTEILQHPLKDEFLRAAQIEIGNLKAKDCFTLVDQEEARDSQILPLKWVFTYKFDENGNFIKAKGRICVRGDLEKDKVANNFAATASARVFRAVMALVAAFDLDTDQKDAVNAFLNALLDEAVYTRTPEGFHTKGKIWKLRKALYGLRKSPRLWQRALATTLLRFGLIPVPEEQCLFVNEYMIVLVYVDDILVINLPTPEAREAAKRFKEALAEEYELRNMGEVGWFLGVRIIRDRPRRKLWLCQDAYLENIAVKFHLHEHARQPNTPYSNTINVDPNPDEAPESKKKEYSMKIGSAQYPAMITRPDIAFMISRLSEELKNPSQDHIRAADRVIEYLYNTRFFALEFSAKEEDQEVAIIASDAAYGDRPDRRSSAGYLVKLYNGPVEWKSGKQRAVTTSTTEAEFLALSEAAKAVYWWRRVFNTMGFDPQHELTVSCDNQQTVRLVNHEDVEHRSKLRHVDIHRSWLRQEAQRGDLHVKWTPTDQMIADGLTKALSAQQHAKFVKMLNLVNIEDLILAQEGR